MIHVIQAMMLDQSMLDQSMFGERTVCCARLRDEGGGDPAPQQERRELMREPSLLCRDALGCKVVLQGGEA